MFGLLVQDLSVELLVCEEVTELELKGGSIIEGTSSLGTLKMEPEDIILCALVD